VCPVDGQTIYSDVARTPPNRGMNRPTLNARQRNLPANRTSFSTFSKKQRTFHNQEPTIPQDFSLNGSSLRQRYLLYKSAARYQVCWGKSGQLLDSCRHLTIHFCVSLWVQCWISRKWIFCYEIEQNAQKH
jgi:hypothetical protein